MSTKPNAWGVHNRTQRHLRAFLPGFEPVKATRSVRRAGTLVTLVTTILFAEGVVAQSGHLWVDPFWLREPPPPDSSSPTPTGRSEPPPEEPRPIQIAPVPQT